MDNLGHFLLGRTDLTGRHESMKTGRETKLIPPHLPFSCISCLHVFLLKNDGFNSEIFPLSRFFAECPQSIN